MNESQESETTSPNRLLDELIRHIRNRSGQTGDKNTDDERIIRMAVRQLRKHPIPASLLGASLLWLLLADDETEQDSPLGRQIEDEVVRQINEGFSYTSTKLKETSDRHPWLMSGLLIAGGLAAALLLPSRKKQLHTEDPAEPPLAERADQLSGSGI